MAIMAGAERGLTLDDNVAAFGELGFAPHIAGLRAERELATTVMGQPISLPVLHLADRRAGGAPRRRAGRRPRGRRARHGDGAELVRQQAVEEVVAANPQTFLQVYWAGSREAIEARVERARAAGVAGLIVTLDWSFSTPATGAARTIPERLDARTMVRFAPEVLRRPRWVAAVGADRLAARPRGAQHGRARRRTRRRSSAPTASGWGRRRRRGTTCAGCASAWDGPFMLKGVMRVDDARRAVDVGVTAISVSNHGGNNLDGTPATIRALAAVVEAVGERVEVLLDGGIRRGSDVVKALALGARAVMIGRAYLWGLAANGQAGVENVLDILRNGIDSALLGLGRGSVRELTPDDLVIPDGFARRLG